MFLGGQRLLQQAEMKIQEVAPPPGYQQSQAKWYDHLYRANKRLQEVWNEWQNKQVTLRWSSWLGPNRTIKKTKQLDRNRRKAMLANTQEMSDDPQYWKQIRILESQSSMTVDDNQVSENRNPIPDHQSESWESKGSNLQVRAKTLQTLGEMIEDRMEKLQNKSQEGPVEHKVRATKRKLYAMPNSMISPDPTELPDPLDDWMKEAKDQFLQGYDEVDYVQWMKPKESSEE